MLDHFGDALAVGLGGPNRGLRAHDPARRDELHRARDLLRALHALDASAQNALLPTSHAYSLARSEARPAAGEPPSLAGELDTRFAPAFAAWEGPPSDAITRRLPRFRWRQIAP